MRRRDGTMAFPNLKSVQVSASHTLFSKIVLSYVCSRATSHQRTILAFDTIFQQKETQLRGERTACRSGQDSYTNLARHVFPETRTLSKMSRLVSKALRVNGISSHRHQPRQFARQRETQPDYKETHQMCLNPGVQNY